MDCKTSPVKWRVRARSDDRVVIERDISSFSYLA